MAADGVALNQFINAAVTEKLSALRTESDFAERAGKGNPPETGDELPEMQDGEYAMPLRA